MCPLSRAPVCSAAGIRRAAKEQCKNCVAGACLCVASTRLCMAYISEHASHPQPLVPLVLLAGAAVSAQ